MTDINAKVAEQNDAKVKKLVDDMTLFDDDLMTLVFNQNIPATELLLRIILGRKIQVTDIEVQEELRSPIVGGRDITLDVHAIDVNGDEIGMLMHDFNSKTSDGMYYKELAEGLHHFKETEEGRDVMCESVKKYAAEFAEEYKTEDIIETVKNLMTNMKWTLEQTLTNMGVSDRERSIITQQLQK